MKFKVGEIAIVSASRTAAGWGYVGSDCEILEAGPFNGEKSKVNGLVNHTGDYLIRLPDGVISLIDEHLLRKRRPPEERGSWVDIYAITGWMPLEHARMKVCQKN